MPGIVGLVTKLPRADAERQLAVMMNTLCHESFYTKGIWSDGLLGVYVGWVARAGSFCDNMPLVNEGGQITMVFSGEDHSQDCQPSDFNSQDHTRVLHGSRYLLNRYKEDPAFPSSLNGWFHGLVVDYTNARATLFNDHFGMHRLYYHESKDAFYFAGEAKAILAVRPDLRDIDPQGLGEWLECGCVLQDRTLFRGVRVLPPASLWTFGATGLQRKEKYFRYREWQEQEPLKAEDFHNAIRDVFVANLPRRFVGREKVGMSLTGGLDTRMIMAWHRPAADSLPCYTFGGTYRESRDVTIARKVAKVCGQSHQVIRCGSEFLSRFPYFAERTIYLSDACADVGCSPVLYGCQQAREIAPARMTGNYGDQVLRGLRAFKPMGTPPGLFASDLQPQLTAARRTYSQIADTHPLVFAAFRQAPWHHQGLLALEQTQLSMRSPYLDRDFVRTLFRAPESATQNNNLRLRLISDGSRDLRDIRTDMGYAGREGYISTILRQYQNFTFKAEYAYDHGMPNALAQVDHMLSRLHLERLFLGRHKYYHFRVWYRDVLRDYVRQILLDPLTLSRPYWQRSFVEEMVSRHIKGDRNHTYAIHKVISLELAHRLFIDSKPRVVQDTRFAGTRIDSAFDGRAMAKVG
jgi:asparagine synthase (glutamine-hydrolysing)